MKRVGRKGIGSSFIPPGKLLLMFLFLGVFGRECGAQNSGAATDWRLQKSAQVLRKISAMPQNGVPDAVLNNTKCLIVVPSATRREGKVEGIGVITYRSENTWSAPTSIRFTGSGIRGRTADLVIFLMTEGAVQALRGGEFRIGREDRAPAPLVKTTPVPQVELHADAFTYEWAKGLLSSSRVIGTILANPDASPAEINRTIRIHKSDYVSTVISFVNTITPTGIVLHHTAVIPGREKPPRTERAIDKYNEERGFEILCSGRIYHVAYHYLIMSDGTIKAGRPERCEGAHASAYNSYLGISVVGDFSSRDNPTGARGPEKPSRAQIASLVRLCRRLRRRYNIPLHNIVPHSDISNTECPGDRFPYRAILDQLRREPLGAGDSK
jgi:lipid-binding SYLF domain-containing protein